MRSQKLPWVLLFLIVSATFCFGQAQPDSGTGVEGVITVSPAHPGPTREGVPSSAPFANTAFTVQNENGPVGSFITDNQGKFRISLSPGHYTISVKEPRIRGCGPFDVDVVASRMTKVEWQCDTGMR